METVHSDSERAAVSSGLDIFAISNVFILLVRGHLYVYYDNDDISSLLISLWLAIHHSWNTTKIMFFFFMAGLC